MQDLPELIVPDAAFAPLKAQTKRQAFEIIAQGMAPALGVEARRVLDLLLERESLGSTALGEGVAAPHARVPGLKRPAFAPALLETPLDFAAPDDLPCDILVVLLSPEDAAGDHLRALAKIARTLKDPALCGRIRRARSRDMLTEAFGFRRSAAA